MNPKPNRSAHRANSPSSPGASFWRHLSLFLVTGMLLGGFSACGNGASDESPTTWRFAIEETAGSVQDAYAQEFKRRIEERTQGRIEVKVYPYGTLGTSDDITEQLRMGSLQFAMASPGHLGKTIPELQVFLLHFLFSDHDEVNREALQDPEFRAAVDPLFPEKGMRMLDLLPEGWMVWTTQKEIRKPADFEGVKIRTMTSPLLLAAYEAYGASPQAMPYGEVYSGLQLNMIDAQVNPVFAIEEMSFYEVTSHMIFAKAAPFLTTCVAHEGFLDGLTKADRALVLEVVAELRPYLWDFQLRTNEERLQTIRGKKPSMEWVELTEAERAVFRERSQPVREQFIESVGERGRTILDALTTAVERAESGREAQD